jgi:hypothetical protein
LRGGWRPLSLAHSPLSNLVVIPEESGIQLAGGRETVRISRVRYEGGLGRKEDKKRNIKQYIYF